MRLQFRPRLDSSVSHASLPCADLPAMLDIIDIVNVKVENIFKSICKNCAQTEHNICIEHKIILYIIVWGQIITQTA